MKSPERFTPVTWEGDSAGAAFRAELEVDG